MLFQCFYTENRGDGPLLPYRGYDTGQRHIILSISVELVHKAKYIDGYLPGN